MIKVSVGLVAYNMSSKEILEISKSLNQDILCKKVVVDNSLLDLKRDEFEEHGWEYFHNPKNPGFGASHNWIFENFGRRNVLHLVINPDITYSGKVIEKLAEFLILHPKVSLVMPKILYPDGRDQDLAKLLPRPIDLLYRRMPTAILRKKRTEIEIKSNSKAVFKTPFVSGCFMLVRSADFLNESLFDQRFFMYAEDLDLCRRIWAKERFVYANYKVAVRHGFKKESSTNLKLLLIHVKSVLKYYNKWGWFDPKAKSINTECLMELENNIL